MQLDERWLLRQGPLKGPEWLGGDDAALEVIFEVVEAVLEEFLLLLVPPLDVEEVGEGDDAGGCEVMPRIAMTAEDGGEGEAADPEEWSLLPSSELMTSSMWPSLFMAVTTLLGLLVGVLFSISISLICSCLISSFESGIKYLRT